MQAIVGDQQVLACHGLIQYFESEMVEFKIDLFELLSTCLVCRSAVCSR